MRKFIFFALLIGFCNHGITQNVPTWDPDSDGDNLIGVNDLLALLGVFGNSDNDDDGIWDDVDECVGTMDICGVCNGPGAIYECGCTTLDEEFCNCNGDTLDAIGVCGGSCLIDLNGDGVCDNDPCQGLEVLTFDNYNYDLVAIANSCWFAENLRSMTFANGDSIGIYEDYQSWWFAYETSSPLLTPPFPGGNQEGPGFNYPCIPERLGYHYNFYAVTDNRGLCPVGWHVPSKAELDGLINEVSSSLELRATSDNDPDEPPCNYGATVNWNGSDVFGFKAIKSMSTAEEGYTFSADGYCLLWTSTEAEYEAYQATGSAFRLKLDNLSYQIKESTNGFSVRCIKDAE